MEKVRILLVGIGGYAATHLNPLLDGKRPDAEIVGCVDPYPTACRRLEEVKALGVPMYADMEDFFADGHTADLAVITTPIHLHARQMKLALAHGCHVMLEKPLCGDVRDIPSMRDARDRADKYVGIGYQWSHSEAIQSLKKDIMSGLYGKPVLLKTIVLWPRDRTYYGRGSGWAGKLRAADGSLILDSVANNATAHYLHNILYVLGQTVETSTTPLSVRASLWRANAIENYDTCCFDLKLNRGGRGLFIVSHAIDRTLHPVFDYEFEKGRVLFDEGNNTYGGRVIRGVLEDGTEKVYGDPFAGETNKLFRAIDAVKDRRIRPLCGIEAATPHAIVIAEAQKNPIHDFPAEAVHENAKGTGVYVEGLYESLRAAYDEGRFWEGL